MFKIQPLRAIALGSASGTLATVPMTIAMELLRFALLKSRGGTFPPRQVVQGVVRQIGLEKTGQPIGESALIMITAVTHFGFGGVAGGIYGLAMSVLQGHTQSNPVDSDDRTKAKDALYAAAQGAGFGTLVWAASYFGWLPALGIVRPQGDYPIRKNIILGLSHLVWGATTGLAFYRFQRSSFFHRPTGNVI
jgi:hypothetical protein